MQKLFLWAALLSALAATPTFAQTLGGNVSGHVFDQRDAAVPGSEVTLQGSDATFRFTSEGDGSFRFLNLEPGTYKLSAALSGFRPAARTIVVAVGGNVDAPLTLFVADVVETVTVSAPAPIVDAKATGTATTFSRDELTNIPTSRDPFSLMRTVPGVLLDRVNVGGNETGQAPTVVSKGTRPQD